MRSILKLGIPIALTAGAVVALSASGFFDRDIGAGAPRRLSAEQAGRSALLAEARRTGRIEDLDLFVSRQRALAESDNAEAKTWRILAEAHLERALARGVKRGMRVGTPVYQELPEAVRQDLDLGDAALSRAREHGDASSDSYRIEAALRTIRVTGIGAALKHDGAVRSALETSIQLDPSNPRALVAIACRKLFKPGWLGGNPAAALTDLLAAAEVLPRDERPTMFASMAAYLTDDKPRALELCRRSAAINPANPYVVAVLGRLERDEEDPFGRDVD